MNDMEQITKREGASMGRINGGFRYQGVLCVLLFAFAAFVVASPVSEAGKPEGKGNGKANGNQGQAKGQQQKAANANQGKGKPSQTAQGASRSQANRSNAGTAAGRSAQARQANSDQSHPHQRRNNLDKADRSTGAARSDNARTKLAQLPQGHGAGHGIGGREGAMAHVDSLLKSLQQFEKEISTLSMST